MRSLLASLFLVLLSVSPLLAQFHPEFALTMTMKSGNFNRPAIFGYDPQATDSCDVNLGEDRNYPPPGFKDFYMKNHDPSFTDGATTHDYRHKPSASSFEIDYEWYATSDELPFTISWDPSSIPTIINHIYVVPAPAQSHILLDMKKQSSVTVTADSTVYYQDCIIRVLYNTEAGVEASPIASYSLLSELAVSPNPSLGSSTLSLRLSRTAEVAIHAYDISGRVVIVKTFKGASGLNELPITISNYHGPVYVRVDAASDFKRQSQNLTLMVQ